MRNADVVIVGAGFGGMACARALGGSGLSVLIVDRRNYHLFVPLLYQVATAALSPADIARPIRRMVARHLNVEVTLDTVQGVDVEARQVELAREGAVGFGRLVIAAGSSFDYFGHDGWAKAAPGPRTIEDARAIRARLLGAFELAETSDNPVERERLLTTIIIGGGPTGVEMAGSVAELTRYSLARDFRRIDPTSARIVLVEAQQRIMGQFPESISAYAVHALTRLGVTVLTGKPVDTVQPGSVTVDGAVMEAGCIIWAAGVAAAPAAAWLGMEPDRQGRVPVGPDLSVAGLDGIYIIGDCAAARGRDGKPLPALAQVAAQQGRWLGRALRRSAANGSPLPPFRYRNRGDTAIIGRNAAIVDLGWITLKGRIGWLAWAIVHIYLLTGFQNRALVAMRWLWLYLTYQRGARLITGREADPLVE